MKGRFFSGVLFLGAALSLLTGLGWLIHLRFESGQAYAPGSSLRTDPLGAKALHDAYAALPGIAVARNFLPLSEVDRFPSDAVLLFLNMPGRGTHALADIEAIDRFLRAGGHLVIAMDPRRIAYNLENDTEETSLSNDPEVPQGRQRRMHTRSPRDDQAEFWGKLSFRRGEHAGGHARRVVEADMRLPERLPWREGGELVDYDSVIWTPIYRVGDAVVMAGRSYGAGGILVMTDDYLFSNEALLKHREPEWLAWILADKARIIFEETHLGVAETTGVAMLMRRYQLGGFMSAFAVFMALVVWRGASPLLPPFAGRTHENVVRTEYSTEAGLSDLVRRSVLLAELPEAAFRHWKNDTVRTPADRRYYAAELEAAERLLADYRSGRADSRQAEDIHSQIHSIINRKKRNRL